MVGKQIALHFHKWCTFTVPLTRRVLSWSLKCVWLMSWFLLSEKCIFLLSLWLVSNCTVYHLTWLFGPSWPHCGLLPSQQGKDESRQGWETASCGFVVWSFSLLIHSFPQEVKLCFEYKLSWLTSPGSKDRLRYKLCSSNGSVMQRCSSYFTFIN